MVVVVAAMVLRALFAGYLGRCHGSEGLSVLSVGRVAHPFGFLRFSFPALDWRRSRMIPLR